MLSRLAAALCAGRGVPCAAVLAALSWFTAVSAVRQKSNTFDEVAHLTAGYSYWALSRYHLNPENGNFPQRLAALPLLGSGCRFPKPDDPALLKGDAWTTGRTFFFELGNPIDGLLFRSRAVMALTGAALVLLVFFWSRALWGVPGALTSACLAACCPTLLANAPLVTSDATAAFFFLASAGLVWRLLHTLSPAAVLLTGACLGCLALSKMSAPLIAPVALVLAGIRIAWGPPLRVRLGKFSRHAGGRLHQAVLLACALTVSGLLAVVIIWGAFSFTFKGPQPRQVWHAIAARPEIMPRLAAWARGLRLLPEPYLYGFSYAMIMSQQRAAFLNGRYSTTGWPHFFAYTFLVKTPLSTLALLLCAAAIAARRRLRFRPEKRAVRSTRQAYRLAPLIVFLLCYGAATLASSLNIGHRHLLPAYPALHILAGGIACSAVWRTARLRRGVLALLLLLAAEMLAVWPNYIAYFNILAGGPAQAYRHLVDSSLDWGQDLRELKKWLAGAGLERQYAPPVYLSYFGTADAGYYNIKARLLPGFFDQSAGQPARPLGAGVYCISATMLQCVGLPYAPGPVWREAYEQNYRRLQRAVRRWSTEPGATALQKSPPQELVTAFRQLRFAKLCAYLRGRNPDYQINYSILIYYLRQDELDRALAASVP